MLCIPEWAFLLSQVALAIATAAKTAILVSNMTTATPFVHCSLGQILSSNQDRSGCAWAAKDYLKCSSLPPGAPHGLWGHGHCGRRLIDLCCGRRLLKRLSPGWHHMRLDHNPVCISPAWPQVPHLQRAARCVNMFVRFWGMRATASGGRTQLIHDGQAASVCTARRCHRQGGL